DRRSAGPRRAAAAIRRLGGAGSCWVPFENAAQLLHGQPDARLDGAEREVEIARDSAMRLLVEEGKAQNLRLLGGQLGEGALYAAFALRRVQKLLRRQVCVGRLLLGIPVLAGLGRRISC